MQQALPYRTWLPAAGSSTDRPASAEKDAISNNINGDLIATSVLKLVSENAVIVFGRSGCCMCHVVKRLLLGHGVNPAVYEVDEQDEAAVIDELSRIISVDEGKDVRAQFPAVFVGGKLFGGLERVMATHISGELVPILKEAGALWL